jgi:hypothetical protein
MLSYAQKYDEQVNIILGEHFIGGTLLGGSLFSGDRRIYDQRIFKKTLVFDLDETIGHFKQLYCLYQIIIRILNRLLTQTEFNELIDLYPEFFRVGIFSIFELLYRKKKQKMIDGLYIYTNNKCDSDWVKMITAYIDSKVCPGESLFDDHILAFKIRNRVVEIRRTTETKTYADLIRCLMLPEEETEICFIDNTEYTKMCNNKVYYILPRPYYHLLKKAEIMRRFFHLSILSFTDKKRVETEFKTICCEVSNKHTIQTIDATKKIMYYVREFLLIRKISVPRSNKTRRISRKDMRQMRCSRKERR